MTDITALLQQLGFSEYEARTYLALLQRNPLNGYELAKVAGLPRANIYAVLQRLEERGAVTRLDEPNGTRYAPVAPAELTERIGSRFHQVLSAAQRALQDVVIPADQEYVWNIRGYSAFLEHAQSLIGAARTSLLIATTRQEAGVLGEALAQAERRGAERLTLCLDDCPSDCGNCGGVICRYCATRAVDQRWLMLVSDDTEMLAGEIDPHGDVLAVRTRQRLQVDLASWYIRHTVTLTAVLSDLNSYQDQRLRPETQAFLRSVERSDRRGGWLDHMRALLQRSAR
jgi:HTH-type transcriptional regulator, sugar sensing transcriptional regulator